MPPVGPYIAHTVRDCRLACCASLLFQKTKEAPNSQQKNQSQKSKSRKSKTSQRTEEEDITITITGYSHTGRLVGSRHPKAIGHVRPHQISYCVDEEPTDYHRDNPSPRRPQPESKYSCTCLPDLGERYCPHLPTRLASFHSPLPRGDPKGAIPRARGPHHAPLRPRSNHTGAAGRGRARPAARRRPSRNMHTRLASRPCACDRAIASGVRRRPRRQRLSQARGGMAEYIIQNRHSEGSAGCTSRGARRLHEGRRPSDRGRHRPRRCLRDESFDGRMQYAVMAVGRMQ